MSVGSETVSQQSGLPIGLSSVFTYDSIATDAFYFKHFSVPSSVDDCQIFAFLSLDEFLNVNNVSLTSDCFSLNIGDLQFNQGLRHVITLPGGTNSNPSRSFISKSYPISSDSINYGYFTLYKKNESKSVIELSYGSSDGVMTGTFQSVSIAILNSESTTDAYISGNQLMFSTDTKIFSDYDVRIVGTLSTNQTSSVELGGEFLDRPSSFRSDLLSYLSRHLQIELQDVMSRSRKAEESVMISKAWQDHLKSQLSENKAKLSMKEDILRQSNDSLTSSKSTANIALNNLNRVLAYFLLSNNSLSLNALLCNEGDTCSTECRPGVSCMAINRTVALSVPGSCLKTEPVQRPIKQVKKVLVNEWQQQLHCQSCWKTKWLKFLYLSQTSCCRSIKVQVETHKYKVEYVNGTINEKARQQCIIANNLQTSTASECSVSLCLYKVTNASCFNQKAFCIEKFAADFVSINETISYLYNVYLNSLLNVEAAELNFIRSKANVTKLRENIELLESLYTIANESYHTNVRANISLFEEIRPLISFIDSFTNRPVTNFIVTNVSFHTLLTNYTPVTLPVSISYSVVARGEEYSFNDTINFLEPRQHILRQLSSNLLTSYISSIRRSQRKKRETVSETPVLDTKRRFHETCIKIKGMSSYVEQIMRTLEESFLSFNSSIDSIKNATSALNASLLGGEDRSSTIAMEHIQFKSETFEQNQILTVFLHNNSFALWQSQMEAIHNNVSQFDLFGCSSYFDCMGSVVSQFEDILEDTPNALVALDELRNIKGIVLQVSYNKSLTYDEALSALKQLHSSLESRTVTEQWCIEPPLIVVQPPLLVSAEVDSSVVLSCTANSALRLRYHWTKDNKIIPRSNSNSLKLMNVQLEDEGEYSCVAINDAGSATSLPSIVSIVIRPTLNLSLPRYAYVHEGGKNSYHLTCDAYGVPSPGWMWFYRQNEADNWYRLPNANSNVLTLLKPERKDKGWYQCMASNTIGNATSTPVHFVVLSTRGSSIQYAFSLIMSGARDAWVNPIIDSIASKVNISTPVVTSRVSLTRLSGNISSLRFAIQTTSFEYNPSLNFNMIAGNVSSSLAQLEASRDALDSFLRGSNNQLTFTSEGKALSISFANYTIGPRTFICSKGYQLDSDHIRCGMFTYFIA